MIPFFLPGVYGAREPSQGSALVRVGFAAVLYGGDQDGIAEVVEAGAVVADSEAELGRLAVREALDIAFPGGEITSHARHDTERGGLVDSAAVGSLPGDPTTEDLFAALDAEAIEEEDGEE